MLSSAQIYWLISSQTPSQQSNILDNGQEVVSPTTQWAPYALGRRDVPPDNTIIKKVNALLFYIIAWNAFLNNLCNIYTVIFCSASSVRQSIIFISYLSGSRGTAVVP